LAAGAALVGGGAALQLLQVRVDALVALREQRCALGRSAMAVFRVARAALAASEGDKLRPHAVPLLAPPGAGAADLPKGLPVVLAAVGARRGSGAELLPPPPQGNMAVGLWLQAAPRTQAVQRAVAGALAEIARGIAGAPRRRRHGPLDAAGCEVECVATGIAEADGGGLGNGIVAARRQAEHVVALRTLHMAHGWDQTPREKSRVFAPLAVL
jgi:hypothetical protein